MNHEPWPCPLARSQLIINLPRSLCPFDDLLVYVRFLYFNHVSPDSFFSCSVDPQLHEWKKPQLDAQLHAARWRKRHDNLMRWEQTVPGWHFFYFTKVPQTNWQSLVVKTPDGRAGSRRFVLSRNEWSAVDRLSAPIISWMSLARICRGLAETCVEFPMLPATRGFQIKTESVVLYYSLRNKLFMPASTCQHAHCLRCNYRRVDT